MTTRMNDIDIDPDDAMCFVDAMRHAFGVIDATQCYACYCETESACDASRCPECDGVFAIIGIRSSGGVDPYNVDVLACGHDVMALGAADADLVVIADRRRSFHTMTLGGIYGSSFKAMNVEDAALAAERAGYDVLDVMDDVIVIGERAANVR